MSRAPLFKALDTKEPAVYENGKLATFDVPQKIDRSQFNLATGYGFPPIYVGCRVVGSSADVVLNDGSGGADFHAKKHKLERFKFRLPYRVQWEYIFIGAVGSGSVWIMEDDHDDKAFSITAAGVVDDTGADFDYAGVIGGGFEGVEFKVNAEVNEKPNDVIFTTRYFPNAPIPTGNKEDNDNMPLKCAENATHDGEEINLKIWVEDGVTLYGLGFVPAYQLI